MASLTENLIMQKTKMDNIEFVKNLNVWGLDLQDVSILQRLPLVEVLSLSVNKIDSLESFRFCHRLRELYLRKNMVADLNEVQHLSSLAQLRILWLCENPCADNSAHYRPTVIRLLPQLSKLDNLDITPEERQQAEQMGAAQQHNRHSSPISAPSHPQAPQPKPREEQAPVRREEVMAGVRSKWQREPSDDPPPRSQPPMAQAQQQQQQQQQQREKPKSTRGAQSQKNILTAVLSLIPELTGESLEVVQQEVHQRLRSLG